MAERRMFAKTIIDSDAFLDMPVTARLLYYDLGMRADDDGFVNSPKKIMRMVGASADDLRVLIGKKFLIPFDNGVVVIKHWRIHNYIRKDTYNETTYLDEKAQLTLDENKAYKPISEPDVTGRGRVVDGSLTQVRLGKVSIGKVRGEIESSADAETPSPTEIVNLFNEICTSFPQVNSLSETRKKAIRARLRTYTVDDFRKMFEKAEASSFLKGSNNRDWTANFDWLIKDGNMAKVLDGNYDDKKGSPAGSNDALEAFFAKRRGDGQ